jgi:hypothetical protein
MLELSAGCLCESHWSRRVRLLSRGFVRWIAGRDWLHTVFRRYLHIRRWLFRMQPVSDRIEGDDRVGSVVVHCLSAWNVPVRIAAGRWNSETATPVPAPVQRLTALVVLCDSSSCRLPARPVLLASTSRTPVRVAAWSALAVRRPLPRVHFRAVSAAPARTAFRLVDSVLSRAQRVPPDPTTRSSDKVAVSAVHLARTVRPPVSAAARSARSLTTPLPRAKRLVRPARVGAHLPSTALRSPVTPAASARVRLCQKSHHVPSTCRVLSARSPLWSLLFSPSQTTRPPVNPPVSPAARVRRSRGLAAPPAWPVWSVKISRWMDRRRACRATVVPRRMELPPLHVTHVRSANTAARRGLAHSRVRPRAPHARQEDSPSRLVRVCMDALASSVVSATNC